ncbi:MULTISPECIES: hypothetical protein [unclassified Pseudoalteromonas]|uniref:hypothetical protein n=1 Tax=unclassified Pseudoalteromonas TaxID=194690 RepID=UPI0025B392CE|nr:MULTISPECIES: hypothetical protein [unclassified Pseudoalteromonas]MDN3432566.1 hypothetical protein [Pseudoalteromonas sp. APC 3907]MDN3435819.1 hypothetical protein [Pseudoalteromonas sp. APC 3356]MDN3466056.1 hypothetical protein [Pseudoalteromonas sp. APC 3495]
MSHGIPKISEFPCDDRYWRVDWFGAIERNPNVPSEPFLQIVISPLIQNESIHSTAKHLASTHVTNYDEQTVIRIGVGQLPFISIGSIWLNGQCQAAKAGQTKLLHIHINEHTTKYISGNHKIKEKNLVPYEAYRMGKGFMANLMAIEHDKDPYGILIPVMELIRFYYAVSTDTSHIVFSGDLKHQPQNVINTKKCGFDEGEKRCILHLRQYLSDEDGWIIGRALICKEAWLGFTLPHDTIMKHSLNTKFLHPQSAFPFSGSSNLKVRGKFIPAKDELSKSGWRYLVLGITHCTALFPFEHLTADRDNNNNQAEGENKINDGDKKPAYPQHKTSNADKPFQSQNEPNKNKTNEHVLLPTDRFGAIMGKKVDRSKKDQCRYISALRYVPKEDEPKYLGTGQSNSGDPKIGRGHANQTRTRRQALPASFEAFEEAIQLLTRVEGVKARLRPIEEAIEYIPLTKSANKRQWSYLDSNTRCRRQVTIADIHYQNRWYTLIEFEMRNKENFSVALVNDENYEYCSNQRLNNLLHQLSMQKGIWLNIRPVPKTSITTMKHTWSRPLDFKSSIFDRL